MTGKVGGGFSPGDITVQPAPSNTERLAKRRKQAGWVLDTTAMAKSGYAPRKATLAEWVIELTDELAAARAETERLRELHAATKGYLRVHRCNAYDPQEKEAKRLQDALAALAEAAPEEERDGP